MIKNMEKKTNENIELIKSRKSIRKFTTEKISKENLLEILECGRWSPSGLNNQPWFVMVVIHSTVKTLLAELTKYGNIIENANANFVVFLDLEKGYNRVKDILGIGAFMQNLLLGAHALGFGSVWLGEILNNKEKVNEIFKLNTDKFELMGVIAIGKIDKESEVKEKQRERKSVESFTDWFH